MKLNLGCFNEMLEGFVNVDLRPPADVIWDLTETPWPWEDASCDVVKAWDILEHMPSFVSFINECHRVLRYGGIADIVVPTPCDKFWYDPTHIRPYHPESFEWYCKIGTSDNHMGLELWREVDTISIDRPQNPCVRVLMTK